MNFKSLILFTIVLTSVCNASLHNPKKQVNGSCRVELDQIDFRDDGMFLQTGIGHPIRIYSLKSEDGEYYAIWRVEYRCKGCAKVFNENPGICDRCGSSEIIKAEVDLYPVG